MPIFVLFVFAAVLFGAGAMFSPALPTIHPRIGLAGILALALVVGGGVDAAALDRWDSLFIDYIWFALVVIIFLSGTVSAGMYRAEASGLKDTGWPGPRELMFLLTLAIVFAAPVLTFPVPFGSAAQDFGYQALAIRDGGSLITLAPFHPEMTVVYAPAFPMLIAYLSHQLHAGIQNIELAVGGTFGFLMLWLAYDFGNEIDEDNSRRTGLAFAIAGLIGTGIMFADLRSHYTTLMALCFVVAFLTFCLRWLKDGKRLDILAAAMALGCVPLSDGNVAITLALALIPWFFLLLLAKPRPSLRRWLGMAFGIPLLSLVLISPWLTKIIPLIGVNVVASYSASLSHLVTLVGYHGVVIALLSLVGLLLAVRRRSPLDLLLLVWLVVVIDFSSVGIIAGILPQSITQYVDSLNIAWGSPIIPYFYFGGYGLLWLLNRFGRQKSEPWIISASLPILTIIAAITVLYIAFAGQALALSKQLPISISGALASTADVRAMDWLALNAPKNALILNYPDSVEGSWTPLLAERNTVYFHSSPLFSLSAQQSQMQTALKAFWQNPSNPTNVALLERYDVHYVIVPQIVNRPASIAGMYRWRAPAETVARNPPMTNVPYLTQVFDLDGAQVFTVKTAPVSSF